MARGKSSTQAGYDYKHRRAAAQLKAAMRAAGGAYCARGGEWMDAAQLDLPRNHPLKVHADHVGVARVLNPGGLPDALSCQHHNTQHGARLGNRLRGLARRGQQVAPTRPRVVLEW